MKGADDGETLEDSPFTDALCDDSHLSILSGNS
jgi:hypothetical protein